MVPSPALPRFLAFYAALFMAFGVSSPFMPGLLLAHALEPQQLGAVLAAGTAIRLGAGPLGGRLADRTGQPRLVLALCTGLAAFIALLYAPAQGLGPLLLVVLAHAVVLAPLTPVADALALGSAEAGRGFAYGWVRGAGSAAFIAVVLVSGEMVERAGLDIIVWLNAGLLAMAAGLAVLLPNRVAGVPAQEAGGWLALLRIRPFVGLMVAAGLIGGSHAMHDAFQVIRWREAGLSARESSVLWSLAVASEVVVFVLAGPAMLRRLGVAGAVSLSALAGVLRWSVAASTAWFPAMALIQPLHGLTFALLHLACMAMIGQVVPTRLAATGQAFYATFALGAAGAMVTLASGPLYVGLGAGAFWVMAGLCALALPVAAGAARAAAGRVRRGPARPRRGRDRWRWRRRAPRGPRRRRPGAAPARG